MRKLICIFIALVLSGCQLFNSDDVKNFGGKSNVTISDNGAVSIETVQPDNPNTAAKQTVEFRPDKTIVITQETGGAYENKLGKLKGIFGMAKMYHAASILCVIVGVLLLSLSGYFHLKKRVGISVIIAGGSLTAIGSILPEMGKYVGIAAIAFAILGSWYFYHKYLSDREPKKTTIS